MPNALRKYGRVIFMVFSLPIMFSPAAGALVYGPPPVAEPTFQRGSGSYHPKEPLCVNN